MNMDIGDTVVAEANAFVRSAIFMAVLYASWLLAAGGDPSLRTYGLGVVAIFVFMNVLVLVLSRVKPAVIDFALTMEEAVDGE